MKKSKISMVLTLLLALSVFLAACGGDNTDKKDNGTSKVAQEVEMLDASEIPTMDSIMAEGSTSFTYISNVGEGLYRLDQDGKPQPALVDGEPTISEDSTVYTFKLRDSKWSNGEPVTANDFVYAWQRAIDPEVASPYGAYMMNGKIKNAQAISDAAAAGEKVDLSTLGIKALDDNTLEVTLEAPIVFWEDLFAFPTFYPQNQAFVEEKGDAYASNAENLLYNGPFVMTSWDGPVGTEWVLEKNDTYWDKENVKLEKLTVSVVKDSSSAVNAFEGDETDITPPLSSDLVPTYAGDDRMVSVLDPSVYYLKMNQETPALANKNIRTAIARAFNKEDLVNGILNNGSVVANYLIPQSFVYNPETDEDFRVENGDFLAYDLDAAQAAWKKGLKELGVTEITLRYLGTDTEAAKKMDEYLKNQLETNLPGLTINLENVPFATRIERDNSMDYDLLNAGWGPDYGNAISFSDLFITGSSNNNMGYSNPKYDALVKSAQIEFGDKPLENFKALQESEKILFEDVAIAPTYQRATNILINSNVKNFVNYNYGPDYSFKWMYVEEE